MKVKGTLKGNTVVLHAPVSADKEREVTVDIPDYDFAELEKMDLLELIDYVWSKADKSRVDKRDYREILSDALWDKYKEK